jgi:hypothetical protein
MGGANDVCEASEGAGSSTMACPVISTGLYYGKVMPIT